MYIESVRSRRFPVGYGTVQMNVNHILEYCELLASIGTAQKPQFVTEDADLINGSYAPGHREMILSLEPEGEPEMIVLAYWMPDLDYTAGESLVARLSYEYSDSKAITMVLSEGGMGVFPSAIEYIEREIGVNGRKEVWLFYVNQFQGAPPDDSGLFWKEHGMGTWIKFRAQNSGKQLPKIKVTRSSDTLSAGSAATDREIWDRQSKAIDGLEELGCGDHWQYFYQSPYSDICLQLDAEIVG